MKRGIIIIINGIQIDNYFEGELVRRTEVEGRVGKLRNGKTTGKDDVTGKLVKIGAG